MILRWNPVLVVLVDGREKIINELQIVSVEPLDPTSVPAALVKMSNGDNLEIQSPSYESWKNDFLQKRE